MNRFASSLLLTLFLLMGSAGPVNSQDSETAKLLENALQKLSNTKSYTYDVNSTTKISAEDNDRTVLKKAKIRYEAGFVQLSGTIEIRSDEEQGRSQYQALGRTDTDDPVFFKASPNAEWIDQENTVFNKRKQLQNYAEQAGGKDSLKEIKKAGTEEVRGVKCVKITAKGKKKQLEKHQKETANELITELEVTVNRADFTYWIGEEDNRLYKLRIQTDQDRSGKMIVGMRKSPFEMNVKLDSTQTFYDYEKTNIPEKFRQKYESLKKQKE